MIKRFRLLPSLAAVVLLFLVAACSSDEPATTPPTGEPADSLIRTPVPQQAKDVALEFDRQHQAINQDWDRFHDKFDQWRGSLPECEVSAARAAFRGFAGDFNEVPAKALGLPRPSSLRTVTDKLIEASQGEGAALRRLRDRWQPGDTSLSEGVDQARSAAAVIQKEVEDKVADLQEDSDPEAVLEAQEFSTAFEQVEADWQEFHDSYDSLRQEQSGLTSEEVSDQLADLAGLLADIIVLVGDLPSSDTTEEMAETLRDAASAEEKGLDELQDSVKASAETDGGANESPAGSNASPSSDGSAAFDAFDLLVEKSDKALSQVKRDLKDMVEEGPAKDAAAVQQFSQEYDDLLEAWDQFHRGYDDWLRTEGGCDRAAVLESLREFGLEFSELANRSRELPQTSFLRPMGNLMVEAAGREEEALRILRNTWRPFGADLYSALDQERIRAGRLRRQAGIGMQELIERFELPPR